MSIFWCAALVVFIVLELATVNLVTIWFAVGSLGALITAFITDLWWVQIGVFIVLSALALFFVRPIARRIATVHREPTNADRAIGKTAVVTEEIAMREGRGAVNLEGVIWSATTSEEDPIPVGDEVKVLEIRGAKLLVEKVL